MKIPSFLITLLLACAVVFGASSANAQKILKVGSTPTGIPFTFLDIKTNTIQGVMVDIINEVGKEAGFAVQIESLPFAALIGSLTSRRIDLISAAMFATDERRKVIEFSDGVYGYGDGLMIPADDPNDYQTFADMKGMTLGVQIGTTFVEPAQKSGMLKEVRLYDTLDDMARDVRAKRIQGLLMDYPIAVLALKDGKYPGLKMAKNYQASVVGHVSIGMRKEDTALRDDINAALIKLKANGVIDQILRKWQLLD